MQEIEGEPHIQPPDWYSIRNAEAVQEDVIAQNEVFDAFLPYVLSKFPETEHESLTWAYTTAREAHEEYSKPRKSGQLYFGHILGVTRIAIEEFHITDPAIIKALFLHDVSEDTPKLIGHMSKMNYKEWRKKIEEELTPHIGVEATAIVIALTRPQPNGDDITDEETAREMNEKELASSAVFMLAKAADLLDNARTLTYRKIPNQNETLKTFITFYIRELLKRVYDEYYGEKFQYVLMQLSVAVKNIKQYQKEEEERAQKKLQEAPQEENRDEAAA